MRVTDPTMLEATVRPVNRFEFIKYMEVIKHQSMLLFLRG